MNRISHFKDVSGAIKKRSTRTISQINQRGLIHLVAMSSTAVLDGKKDREKVGYVLNKKIC